MRSSTAAASAGSLDGWRGRPDASLLSLVVLGRTACARAPSLGPPSPAATVVRAGRPDAWLRSLVVPGCAACARATSLGPPSPAATVERAGRPDASLRSLVVPGCTACARAPSFGPPSPAASMVRAGRPDASLHSLVVLGLTACARAPSLGPPSPAASMDGPAVNFERARAFCASLPAVTEDIKWGADLCFCVGGKMFAVTWLDGGKATGFSFKVDEHRFLELTDRAGIIPAPYLARAKWVQVKAADALSDAEARELLARSHALVAAKLTRAVRRELGLEPAPSSMRSPAPASIPSSTPKSTSARPSKASHDPAPRVARNPRPRRTRA